MLKLNTDEIKNLQFEVSIQGINYDELHGSLKFMIEDVEYGIPVKIQKDLVSVEVPPLQEIVAKGMKQGDVVECKLDIFGNGFYINPWGGQFELQTPIKVEAKQLGVTTKVPDKKVAAKLSKVASKEELNNEAILEMLFQKLEEKGFTIPNNEILENEIQPDIPVDPITPIKKTKTKKAVVESTNAQPRKLTKKELVEQKIKSKFSHVNSLIKNVKSLTEGKKVIRNPITQPSVSNELIGDVQVEDQSIMDKLHQLKNKGSSTSMPSAAEQVITVDHDDPIFLMESVGMKNPKVQEVMLEKAKELGGDGSKSLAVTLKQLLGITEATNPYDQYMNLKAKHDQ